MTADGEVSPIASGADLWRRFVEIGTLLPNSYDKDLSTYLNKQLSGDGPLELKMRNAEWTARDLLRAMTPTLGSFAETLRDLLSLYSRIAASQATGENLVISYEFEEGELFDHSLLQFREALNVIERARAARGEFAFPLKRWNFPFTRSRKASNREIQQMRGSAGEKWRFSLRMKPLADDPVLASGASSVYAILMTACDIMRGYGATMEDCSREISRLESGEDRLSHVRRLFGDFRDYWPERVLFELQSDIENLASRSRNEIDTWARGVKDWCELFWNDSHVDAGVALESVLSLPVWGKRHELYSAWVTCVFAKAFERQNLQFEVVNGRLSFPFRATRVAYFEDRDGPVEIWSEVRSFASASMGAGRKQGVQPDYRFLRPGRAPAKTEMAVEVKHYKKAAGARHGVTARDYARALPAASIVLVAHGPIGATATRQLDVRDVPRVAFLENVRSLQSPEAVAFIAKLNAAFPARLYVREVALEYSYVIRAEVRLLLVHGESLSGETGAKGVSVLPLDSPIAGEIYVEIVCHPERTHSIGDIGPLVTLKYSDGSSRQYAPDGRNSSRTWVVGELSNKEFRPSAHTVELARMNF